MNAIDRAISRAGQVTDLYLMLHGRDDKDTVLGDLLTDLVHYVRAAGLDPDALYAHALWMAGEEEVDVAAGDES